MFTLDVCGSPPGLFSSYPHIFVLSLSETSPRRWPGGSVAQLGLLELRSLCTRRIWTRTTVCSCKSPPTACACTTVQSRLASRRNGYTRLLTCDRFVSGYGLTNCEQTRRGLRSQGAPSWSVGRTVTVRLPTASRWRALRGTAVLQIRNTSTILLQEDDLNCIIGNGSLLMNVAWMR